MNESQWRIVYTPWHTILNSGTAKEYTDRKLEPRQEQQATTKEFSCRIYQPLFCFIPSYGQDIGPYWANRQNYKFPVAE